MAEAPNYHNEIIPQGNFASYGHYSTFFSTYCLIFEERSTNDNLAQCMWKTTTRIGMANATAANGGVYTVGRYSPPGNYVGNRPY